MQINVKRFGRVLAVLVAGAAGGWMAQLGNSMPAQATSVSAAGFIPYTPTRVLDTRSGGKPGAANELVVRTGIQGAVAVGVNITMTGTLGPGFVTAWDGASGRPTASIVNSSGADENIANFAIVPVLPDGTFHLYTSVATHLIVDLMGYFPGAAELVPTGVNATITGYGPSSTITSVTGIVTNGSTVSKNIRTDVHCPDGTTETDVVFGLAPGSTKGFMVLCSGVFTSGATVVVVDV